MSYTDIQLQTLGRDGYCVIPSAFSESFCARALAIIHRIHAELSSSSLAKEVSPPKTVRIMNLLQYDALFQEIPQSEAFLPVIERYLDEECLLSGIEGIEIQSGEEAQSLHTDTWWHDDHRFPFPVSVNTVLALVDFTVENGATRVVPGSHLWTAEQFVAKGVDPSFFRTGDVRNDGKRTWEPIAIEAPRGSVILWDSRILHGAGANRSAAARPSVISPYVLGWMRQLDNFAYAIRPDLARTFSPRLQRLIGLECFRTAYGQVNNMSPREWLWGRDEVMGEKDP